MVRHRNPLYSHIMPCTVECTCWHLEGGGNPGCEHTCLFTCIYREICAALLYTPCSHIPQSIYQSLSHLLFYAFNARLPMSMRMRVRVRRPVLLYHHSSKVRLKPISQLSTFVSGLCLGKCVSMFSLLSLTRSWPYCLGVY